MQFSEIRQFYVSAETSVHQSSQIEATPMKATHNELKTKDGDIPVAVVFLAPICFIIVGAFFWVIIANTLKITQNKNGILNLNHLQQYPCRNCRFFNDNNYIKCAVHPSAALTKQALNCSDYQPR